MGTIMNALSILSSVRNAPSAAVSFLVKFGCAISRACGKKGTEQFCFPCSTFCEGLIPDVESPFLGLANVEISNDHPKGFKLMWPVKRNTVLSFAQIPQYQVRNGRLRSPRRFHQLLRLRCGHALGR